MDGSVCKWGSNHSYQIHFGSPETSGFVRFGRKIVPNTSFVPVRWVFRVISAEILSFGLELVVLDESWPKPPICVNFIKWQKKKSGMLRSYFSVFTQKGYFHLLIFCKDINVADWIVSCTFITEQWFLQKTLLLAHMWPLCSACKF